MNRKYLRIAFAAMAAPFLLASCSQEDTLGGDRLPEGAYPLEIASVTMEVEGSEQPWSTKAAQTRVAENADRSGSVWQTGDVFYVKFEGSDKVGKYKITDAGTGAVESVESVYWQSASQEQSIIAWYAPQQEGTIDVSNQKSALTYVMRAEQKATYNSSSNAVSLTFSHQLAKVRVYLRGTAYEGNATGVTLSYPASYTVKEGKVTKASDANGTIQMHKAENANYYEALVLPGTIETNGNPFTVALGSNNQEVNLSAPMTLAASSKNDVTLKLHKSGTKEIDLSDKDYEIGDNGIYYVYGKASHGIKVTGGSPDIYLEDADFDVADNSAISVSDNANPTIHLIGTNNTINTSSPSDILKGYAGIYVAENGSVTITADNPQSRLILIASNGGAGIGGNRNGNTSFTNSGEITIKHVTVYTYGHPTAEGGVSAGIGCAGNGSCKTITIDNATIHAFGGGSISTFAPAIGAGIGPDLVTTSSLPQVIIKNSTIYAHRGGGNADYIGWSSSINGQGGGTGAILPGTGSIINSTVHCYTGNQEETIDKTVVYDANGVGTGE